MKFLILFYFLQIILICRAETGIDCFPTPEDDQGHITSVPISSKNNVTSTETNNSNSQNSCVYGGKGITMCTCIGTIFTGCKCGDFHLSTTFTCNGCQAYPTGLFYVLTVVLPMNCMICICYYYIYRRRYENKPVDDENDLINGSTQLKKIHFRNNENVLSI